MNRFTHIYLSPHLDDAALSCGGRIRQQTQAGEGVLVVTVFAGIPEPGMPLSPFAQEMHARWGHPPDSVGTRREEDLAALALLGAEAAHWSCFDCIYRQGADGEFLYASEEALWGEIDPADEGLIEELAGRIGALSLPPDGKVYAPLGAGHHVDHQVVRRTAEGCGLSLTFYEDFPYADDPEAVEIALGKGPWRPTLVTLSEDALEAKIEAIACHHSQIGVFWEDVVDMAASVRAFAERVGGGEQAERYWTLEV